MDLFILIIVSFCLIFLALILRLIPIFITSNGKDADQWFWKVYIETYCNKRQFPPFLPQYLFDEQQWYPPLFPLIISYLPKVIFKQHSKWIPIIIDLIRLIILLIISNWLFRGNIYLIIISGLIYLTTPILIMYNFQLNPRGLSALLLDGLVILIFWFYLYNGLVLIWIPIIFISCLILLTHKMTTQLLWFLCIGSILLLMDWRLIALIPGSIITAIIVSKGFYWKVLRAHWDIVAFWHRNWPWLQAHPIKESPIYGEKGYVTPTKLHKKGMKGIVEHLSSLLKRNSYVWMICILILFLIIFEYRLDIVSSCLFWWIVLIFIFAICTIFIPFMKCLGYGAYYFYNAAFPVSLLWGFIFNISEYKIVILVCFFLSLIINIIIIIRYYYNFNKNKTHIIDNYFQEMLEFLKNEEPGRIMCFPPNWYDIVAYKTGKQVLFGAHGYGFKNLEIVFPRLLVPFSDIEKKYCIRYIVTMKNYLPQNFIKDIKSKRLLEFGNYQLYII